MTETISIRRQKAGVMVNVTHKDGPHTVHWQERVLGPTAHQIRDAIQRCRVKCAMLTEGIALAEEES